ncbi:hypothetical protein C8R45DRAFT_1091139 [Mycena sanguinolenta]|nr:hypothetical protein C8R45DRAFT_1091139 [Mycena sanguinolenta]
MMWLSNWASTTPTQTRLTPTSTFREVSTSKSTTSPGDADVGTLTFSHPSAEGSFSVQTGQGLTTRPSIASFDNTTLEHVSFITIRLRFVDGGLFINCDGNDVPLPGAFLRATDGIAFGWEHHSAHVAALIGEVHFRAA